MIPSTAAVAEGGVESRLLKPRVFALCNIINVDFLGGNSPSGQQCLHHLCPGPPQHLLLSLPADSAHQVRGVHGLVDGQDEGVEQKEARK